MNHFMNDEVKRLFWDLGSKREGEKTQGLFVQYKK